jgi:signal peptide peptidase SppA
MYPRILQKVYFEPWCILPQMHYAIQDVLEAAIEGHNAVMAGNLQPPPINAVGLGLRTPSQPGSRLYTKGKLGVIPVRGVIGHHLSNMETMCGGYSVEQLENDLALAEEDGSLSRLLLDFHSPGGTVTGVPEAARSIRNSRKETFAFTNGQAASAAYWLASQCQNVYLTDSAAMGSIGVFAAHLDRSAEMDKRGHKLQIVKAGKYKAMGVGGKPLSDEEVALLQEGVDDTYKAFTRDVTARRPGVATETMQGQMFQGSKAVKARLADSVASSLGNLVKRLS